MAEEQSSDEAKLKLFGQRVREGWAKLHPPTEQHRAAVREVVRQQIENLREATQHLSHPEAGVGSEVTNEQRQTKSKTAEHSKSGEIPGENVPGESKNRKQGNDHGHSH